MTRYIILDTGALVRLDKYGFIDDKLLTVPSVLKEIKDKSSLEKLFVLRDRIEVIEPNELFCNFVKKFSRETGDFGFLSETDIHVIALTLMYHKKYDDVSKLNTKPKQISYTREKKDEDNNLKDNEIESCSIKKNENSMEDKSNEVLESNIFSDGWVTKENINRVLGGLSTDSNEQFKVACMTTDYSMQNVILQIGLNLIEINGFSVKNIKRWGLICCGCHTFERDTSKKFCSKCGNATLDRVPIKISSKGTIELDCYKKKVNLRGTIYSIPKPKKGVRNEEIILAEDQLMMGGRQRKINHERKKWEKACKERDPFINDSADLESNWSKKFSSFKYPEFKIGLGKGNPNSNRWQKRNNNRK